MVCHVVDHGLSFSSMKSKEEALEGSRHFDLMVVLEGLVQLGEDHHEAVFSFSGFLSDSLDLLPSDATEGCHQVDGCLFLFLVQVALALVEEYALSPFFVVARLVGEDRDVGVLHKVHTIHRS